MEGREGGNDGDKKEKEGRMTIEKRIMKTDIFVRKISKHRLTKTDEKRKSQWNILPQLKSTVVNNTQIKMFIKP